MQTTDKKVNEVTPALFELAPDAARMANMEVSAQCRCFKLMSSTDSVRLLLQSTIGAQHEVYAVVSDMKACIAELHLCAHRQACSRL